MDEKSKEVTLSMMAGVGGKLRSVGWSGSVTEEEYGQLIAAGAVVVDHGSDDAAGSNVATLVILLNEECEKRAGALAEIAKLEQQLEQQRLDAEHALADASTAAAAKLTALQNEFDVYRQDAAIKVSALDAELTAAKAEVATLKPPKEKTAK